MFNLSIMYPRFKPRAITSVVIYCFIMLSVAFEHIASLRTQIKGIGCYDNMVSW